MERNIADKSKQQPAKPTSAPRVLDESLEGSPMPPRDTKVVLPLPAPAIDTVTRYTVGVYDQNGDLQFTTARQGQYMKATPEEAQTYRENMLNNNSEGTLRDAFGASDPARFVVCSVPCWPNHFDPKGFPSPLEP